MGSPVSIGLVAGCLVWIPVTIWIVALIGWMIQGEVDVLIGFCGLALGVGIGALAFVSRNQEIAPYLLFASISMLLIVPLIRAFANKRELAQMDVEQIEKGYDQLDEKPDNVGAKFRIAKMLYQRGAVEQAVAIADKALEGLPKAIFEDEHRTVRTWKRTIVNAKATQVTCLRCGASNKLGDLYCYRCQGPLMLFYARGSWVHPVIFRRVLIVWMAAMVSIVGIPLAAANLPAGKSTPAVFVLLMITVALGFLAFKGIGNTE
jgi:hypothetical protein